MDNEMTVGRALDIVLSGGKDDAEARAYLREHRDRIAERCDPPERPSTRLYGPAFGFAPVGEESE